MRTQKKYTETILDYTTSNLFSFKTWWGLKLPCLRGRFIIKPRPICADIIVATIVSARRWLGNLPRIATSMLRIGRVRFSDLSRLFLFSLFLVSSAFALVSFPFYLSLVFPSWIVAAYPPPLWIRSVLLLV